jgi:hypothetical protein
MVEGVMFKETLETDVKILGKYSKYIISLDPLVGDIPSAKKLHSGGVIYRSEEKKLEIPLGMMSSEVSLTVADVYNFNLEKICTDIYEFAQGFLRDMTKTMFATLSQVTDFTGNVIDGKGKGVSHEMLLEMLEKIHIDFDEAGNPQFPSLVIHPDMAKSFEKLKSIEELYKSRYDEIINRKREAYYAEKGCRGLSRID